MGGLLPDGTGAEIRAATYTTDTNGMGITFTTAPVNGAAISAVYYTYGGVGLEADCGPVTSTACGGSGVSSYNFLSWSDDIYIRNMSMSFDNGVFADAGAQTCITLDGTNRLAQFTATGLYWCLAQIKAKNNALGIVFNGGVTVVQPASYPTSGVNGIVLSYDVGTTSIYMPATFTTNGRHSYANNSGAKVHYYNGQTCWGCDENTSPTTYFDWVGPNGDHMKWNGSNVLSFTTTPHIWFTAVAGTDFIFQPGGTTAFGPVAPIIAHLLRSPRCQY